MLTALPGAITPKAFDTAAREQKLTPDQIKLQWLQVANPTYAARALKAEKLHPDLKGRAIRGAYLANLPGCVEMLAAPEIQVVNSPNCTRTVLARVKSESGAEAYEISTNTLTFQPVYNCDCPDKFAPYITARFPRMCKHMAAYLFTVGE